MYQTFKSTPTWSFKARNTTITKQNLPSASPGPLDYKPQKLVNNSMSYSIGRSSRDLYKKIDNVPGPGQYSYPSFSTDGEKYSMRKKCTIVPKKTIGPDYDNNTIKIKPSPPKYTMATRSNSTMLLTYQKNIYKPAPTAYEEENFWQHKHGIFIGTSQRKSLYENQFTPAPSAYKYQDAEKKNAFRGGYFKIGNEKRSVFVDNPELSPGPAFYDKKSFLQQGHLKLKLAEKQKKKIPQHKERQKKKIPQHKVKINNRLPGIKN